MTQNSHRPAWVDSSEYPFQSNYFQTEHGRLHYIDEGQGEVLLFVHGTPTWSFLYRNFVKHLSKNYRCIAIDHLGFGLSDKPKDFAGTPELHAQNLADLIAALELKNINLVVHDFGGPIGLSYAIHHPENVARIVLFNTWMWQTKGDAGAEKIDKILHSALGNFLYLRTNFSPKFLLKKAYFNKKKLTKPIHEQYLRPFPNKASRYGLLRIGQSLVGSSDWYQELWDQVDHIKSKPVLILWGVEDAFIQTSYLYQWQSKLENTTQVLLDSGHFVQEECFEQSIINMKLWLTGSLKKA